MKLGIFFTLALSIFVSIYSSAAVLTVQAGTDKMNGVVINQSASTSVDGKDVVRASVGAGLRKKTIAQVKVYVAQLYVSNLDKFNDKNLTPLQALDFPDMTAVALQMTM